MKIPGGRLRWATRSPPTGRLLYRQRLPPGDGPGAFPRLGVVSDRQLHAALPPELIRSGRQPADPPEAVEIWFAQEANRSR
jgi:hypothetical protein